MSFKSRRRRNGLLQRFRSRSQAWNMWPLPILGQEQFELAIAKERCRAERRDLTFCIVRFDSTAEEPLSAPVLASVAQAFRQRLRITDEIGNFRNSLAVLLPETIPSQAAMVANDLTRIATELGAQLASDIFSWPVPDDGVPANGPRADESVEGALNSALGQRVDPGHEGDRLNGSVAMAQHRRTRQASGQANVHVRPLDFSLPTPAWKRALDIAGSLAGLTLLSPIFLAAGVAIKINSPGPALFWQWREGKDGRVFRICKFRTMRQGAEAEQHQFRAMSEQDGPAFKVKDDPRLTPVGKYLRKTCIDELPQLVNVLKGEMSLVGPRPLPVEESFDCSHWQRRRLDVLPGMTCTWQVVGGREIPFEEWMRMDLDYIQRRSPLTDATLLTRTFLVTVLHRGSV